jgi:hypothetical protein
MSPNTLQITSLVTFKLKVKNNTVFGERVKDFY